MSIPIPTIVSTIAIVVGYDVLAAIVVEIHIANPLLAVNLCVPTPVSDSDSRAFLVFTPGATLPVLPLKVSGGRLLSRRCSAIGPGLLVAKTYL